MYHQVFYKEKTIEKAERKTYWGFRSYSANDEYAEEFEDKAFIAKSKEDARKMCAQWLKGKGCEAVKLSTTSEEVYGSINGKEIVYYGFTED